MSFFANFLIDHSRISNHIKFYYFILVIIYNNFTHFFSLKNLIERNNFVIKLIFGEDTFTEHWDDVFLIYFFLFSVIDLSQCVTTVMTHVMTSQRKKRRIFWPMTYRISLKEIFSEISGWFKRTEVTFFQNSTKFLWNFAEKARSNRTVSLEGWEFSEKILEFCTGATAYGRISLWCQNR